MPAGVAPLILPETAVARGSTASPQAPPLKLGRRDEVSHLVAIALDYAGEPIRLFTTNRWVTGETWYRADDVIKMLDCFKFLLRAGRAFLTTGSLRSSPCFVRKSPGCCVGEMKL